MAGLLGAVTANPMMARQFATARQNMTAPTSVMDERYPAWKKSQDQATEFLLAADLLGSAVPAGLLAAPAMKKGLLSMGETVAPKMENYMARQGLLQPITAYHGSPHRFEKFDASKIGTGEGAQAYGHGVYFAESPAVAKQYQNMVRAELNGKPFTPGPFDPEFGALDALHKAKNDYGRAKQLLLEKEAKYGAPVSLAPEVTALEKMQQQGVKANLGNLYTVDLPDPMIAKMLDWDKPLSQQAPEVRELARKLKIPITRAESEADILRQMGSWGKEADGKAYAKSQAYESTGAHLYSAMGKKAEASNELSGLGIPGIRYLDGGSRGTGAGTSNFVVFPGNEQLVKILSRE